MRTKIVGNQRLSCCLISIHLLLTSFTSDPFSICRVAAFEFFGERISEILTIHGSLNLNTANAVTVIFSASSWRYHLRVTFPLLDWLCPPAISVVSKITLRKEPESSAQGSPKRAAP